MSFFLFSILGYSSLIWGSTSHGVLHEKQVQNTIFVKQASLAQEEDQDPRTSDVCTTDKTPTQITCNNTNNTQLLNIYC
jgi:hypothetical protein